MSFLNGSAGRTAVKVIALSGNPRPQSRTHQLAVTLAAELARLIPGAAVTEIELAGLGPRVLDPDDPAAKMATEEVLAGDVLVIASPTYKASYSGLLKSFLDRLDHQALAGKTAVPIMLGGLPSHQLAVNLHFSPLLLELSAKVPAGGLFVLESEIGDYPPAAAAWAEANAATLAVPSAVLPLPEPKGVALTTTEQPPTPLSDSTQEDPVRTAERLRDEFRAGAAERDRERKFPYEQCAAFRASGLLGLMVPREHGGYGGTFTELMKVVNTISAGDSNIGQMYQLHTGGIRLMQEFASPAVQAKWLPRFTRELWITNAYSEVGTSSVNDFNTTVTRDGDGWRLNGKKFYCTGSLAGDITFGPCRVEGTDEVRVFFAPTSAEGVTIHDDWTGFGQRTTASGTTEFGNVWIPDELCLGSPDTEGGGGGAVTSLNYQAVHTGVFVGIARNALDDAVEFVQTRARLWYESTADRASDDLYTQLRVGEMKTAVDAAELLSLRAAELCDEAVAHPGDERIRGEASVVTGQAREAAAEAAMFAGSTLFKVCGAGSVLEKYGFDRHWRNARTLSLHNPLDFKSMHAGDFLLNHRLPPVDSYN